MPPEQAKSPPALPFIWYPVLGGGKRRLQEGEPPFNVRGKNQSSGGHARPRAESTAKGLRVPEPLSDSLSVDLPTRRAGLAAEGSPLEKINLPVNICIE